MDLETVKKHHYDLIILAVAHDKYRNLSKEEILSLGRTKSVYLILKIARALYTLGETLMAIIAEIAQAHDGSLGNALKFIEEAKNCGADAVKFQARQQAQNLPRGILRVNIFPQDSSRFNYWKRMEFSGQDWILIDQTCKKHGIDLIVSPFSVESLRLLEGLNVKYLKIGSGEITNLELISACLKTNLPIIISSGMSSWDELRICSNYCKKFTSNFLSYNAQANTPAT